MKKILLITLLCIGISTVNSQELSLESGKTSTSFIYKDSQGKSLENLNTTNFQFMNIGYRKAVFYENLHLNLNLSYNKYGAVGSDRVLDNFYSWKLNYLGLSVGLDYEVFKTNYFAVYLKGLAASEFLIQGTQIINNQVYSLTKEKDFQTGLITVRGGLGFIYKASENFSVFSQYLYGGSGTIEGIQGSLKMRTHQVGIGILVNLSKKATPQ